MNISDVNIEFFVNLDTDLYKRYIIYRISFNIPNVYYLFTIPVVLLLLLKWGIVEPGFSVFVTSENRLFFKHSFQVCFAAHKIKILLYNS